MTDILNENLKVIGARWPDVLAQIERADISSLNVVLENNTLLINDIQLTSNYDREAEAKIQVQRIPLTSPQAFVYGVGLGDVPLQLLKRDNLKSIVVCILNFDLFLHSLNAVDHTLWLSNPKTNLTTSEQLKDVYKPFVALPADLNFADDNSAKLRDRVVLELDQSYISRGHAGNNINTSLNIAKNLALFSGDKDVSELFNTVTGTIFIAAAGPTLDENISYLFNSKKSSNPCFIIALDAALKPLAKNNIVPDVVVSVDERSHQILPKNINDFFSKTSLVYFPIISANNINSWRGPRYCSYSTGSVYKNAEKHFPKTKLESFGSVIHVATDLAIKMGAKEVIFLGADFGFPDGETYAKGQKHEFTSAYVNSKHWVLNGKGEKIPTMLNYRGYLRDLERYIENIPHVRFLNGSARGALIGGTELFQK